MSTKGRLVAAVAIACALSATAVAVSAGASGGESDLKAARNATARFHDLGAAQAAGYGLFKDAAGIACIDSPGEGGMGVHYVNGSLVGDDVLDVRHPEALVYAPTDDGLQLAAAEYIVFQSAWEEHHTGEPALFGQKFMLVDAPNRFGIPAFYQLHVWLWKPNPSGMFQMWNPNVVCDGS